MTDTTKAAMRGLAYMLAVATAFGFWQNKVLAGIFMLFLLIFIEKLFRIVIQLLSQISSSVSGVNSQLLAFIQGGSTLGDGSPAADELGKEYLVRTHLEFWSYLGQRVYLNHSHWLAQDKSDND
jgi:hypothetical protein